LCRAVLNFLSDPISQRLSQQIRLLQKCLVISAQSGNLVLKVMDYQLLRTDCLPIKSGLLSQVRCFLAPCREDVLSLVDNVALARLPLIVVGPALCTGVLPELGQIHKNGKRESSWRRDGRIAD